MELNTFVKSVLLGIAEGVKDANAELKTEDGSPSFALKNASSYTEPTSGIIWFTLFLGNESDVITVLEKQQTEHPNIDIANKVKFNVVQTNAIA